MKNLIDTFLAKAENIASRPSRFMTLADMLLDQIAPKDIAMADPIGCYTEKRSVCQSSPCGQPPHTARTSRTRRCCAGTGCTAWSATFLDGCC